MDKIIDSRPTTLKSTLKCCKAIVSSQNMHNTDIEPFFKKFTEVARKCDRTVIIAVARILSWFRGREPDIFDPC